MSEANERCARVLGWRLLDREAYGWGDGPPVWSTGDKAAPTYQDPDFEHDIAACFRWLVPWAEAKGWYFTLSSGRPVEGAKPCWCSFAMHTDTGPPIDITLYTGGAETPAEAIVQAFLAAFEVAP